MYVIAFRRIKRDHRVVERLTESSVQDIHEINFPLKFPIVFLNETVEKSLSTNYCVDQ